METFSALLAICVGNSPVPGEFPTQRPVTRSFDVYFDLCPNKWLSKQSLGWWFETLSCSLWRHRNESCTLLFHSRSLDFFYRNAFRITGPMWQESIGDEEVWFLSLLLDWLIDWTTFICHFWQVQAVVKQYKSSNGIIKDIYMKNDNHAFYWRNCGTRSWVVGVLRHYAHVTSLKWARCDNVQY